MHYHTAYGFPTHGLRWTDEEHETTEAAWAAVGEIVGENWRLDKARIISGEERYERVKDSYRLAGALCLSGHLPAGTSFDIPALDSGEGPMSYGVISCDLDHMPCSVTPHRRAWAS